MSKRVWSAYSDAILDAYMAKRNIIVQACPGAGKTTNIERLWSATDEQCIYLVFTKANQEEAERKLKYKQGSNVLTLNSLGHRAILAQHEVTLDRDKVKRLVWDTFKWPYLRGELRREKQWHLINVIRMAKQYITSSVFGEEDFNAMLDMYDLESYDEMYQDVLVALQQNDAIRNVIDFSDQIRFPALFHEYTLPSYTSVLGDEVQDWSPIQAMVVSRIACEHITLVGDRHQSIYGFRGAMCDSMAVLQDRFKCEELPLSISYRCSKAAVMLATQVYAGAIEAWSEACEGGIQRVHEEKLATLEWSGEVLVVCRCTAPLITMAYRLLEMNVACYVRGRAIGDGLISLIKKLDASRVSDLMAKVDAWYTTERMKAERKDDDVKLQALEDKVNTLYVFINKCSLYDVPEVVCEHIDAMFAQGKGVCLSTVHRAKGLEASRVYIVYPHLFTTMQHRARQTWQVEQECNIEYVAVTRSKDQVVYIYSK